MTGRIGDILIEMGFIGEDQLEAAAVEARKTNTLLGEVLLRLGWVTEEQLQMALAVQSGAKMLDRTQSEVDTGDELIRKIPQQFIVSRGCSPFHARTTPSMWPRPIPSTSSPEMSWRG
jgi:type IV pilus assembly protein PilB